MVKYDLIVISDKKTIFIEGRYFLLFSLILIPFVVSFLIMISHRFIKIKLGWAALPVPIVLFLFYLAMLPRTLSGETISTSLSWIPMLKIALSFEINGLSLFFALLISFVGILVILYSIYYLSERERLVHFYAFLLLFMGAMLGIVTSNNLLLLYFFWELTSISSFLLIGFWFEKERSCYGAQKALLITVSGGFCMLISFILIGNIAGTFEINELMNSYDLIRQSSLYPAASILLLIGAFTKSAQVPFHIWLPSAMEAPTPISCYLHSATMVKAGIFLIARFTPLLGDTVLWNTTITFVGLTSLLFGSFTALSQKDLKALLAYSTISQLGLILCLFGIGTKAAIFAGLFHLLNHSAFKGSLFLMTGMVDHETGTRDLSLLHGLGKVMPYTGMIAFVASFSMAGLPPFSGFLSKELFFEAAADAPSHAFSFLGSFAYIIPLIAVLASLFTFVYSLHLFSTVFLGKEVSCVTPKKPHEAPLGMLLPTILLVLLNLIVAFFPNITAHALIAPATLVVSGSLPDIHVMFWHGFTVPLMMTLVVVVGGAILYSCLSLRKPELGQDTFPLSANRIYDTCLYGLPKVTGRFTNFYMTGSLTNYLSYIIVACLLLVGYPILHYGFISAVSTSDLAQIELIEVVMIFVTATAAILATRMKKRVAAILSMGIVGYMVAMFFVMFGAPDLALTQLLVETVTLILYVLVLKQFPLGMEPHTQSNPKKRVSNILLSLLVGLSVAFLSFFSHSNRFYESISWFYTAFSKSKGGGSNIVNVTLVDFRGLDTLGEITVLCLASLSIYVVLHLFTDKSGKVQAISDNAYTDEDITYLKDYTEANTLTSTSLQKSHQKDNDLVILTFSKPVSFIILFVSVYLLLAGHNAPGGGFIAGLMTSCALLLMYITIGKDFMSHLPFKVGLFLPLGLSIVGGCGILSIYFHKPFLTQTFGHIILPWFGKIELASALIFDIGVYFVVLGTVMSILFNIGKTKS